MVARPLDDRMNRQLDHVEERAIQAQALHRDRADPLPLHDAIGNRARHLDAGVLR